MAQYTIIDRRLNPHGKSLPNRQKFLERNKEKIKQKIRESFGKRSIKSEDDEDITISSDGIDEPHFNYDYKSGDWEQVLPGNKEYTAGDEIEKDPPPRGGKGNKAADDGDGEDSFNFSISKEEYLQILFEDLELPNLVKKSEKAAIAFLRKRAGYSKEGSSSALDLPRSLKNSYGRRIALAFPLDRKIRETQDLLDSSIDEVEIEKLTLELKAFKTRRAAIAYIDQVDVRYKRYDKTPVPNTRAVMFCIMDVSGSMDEEKKDISKRFFLLLYLFLKTKYKTVEVVFIRHTTTAEEVDENTFFYDRQMGGTIVSSSYDLTSKIMKDRFDENTWNVYGCQCSDGDNFSEDNSNALKKLKLLLPSMQYFIYMEIKSITEYLGMMGHYMPTNLSALFKDLHSEFNQFLILKLDSVDEVIPKFREAFTSND